MMPVEASPQPGILAGVRILDVDDDAACRRAHKQLFTVAGATAETARRAQDAFAAFCRTRPPVVVSDLVTPGEDGCWLMRRIRAAVGSAERRLRAIVVTGRAGERERTRCLAAGFDAC